MVLKNCSLYFSKNKNYIYVLYCAFLKARIFLMTSFPLNLSILCLIFPSEDVILNHFLSMIIVHMAASHHIDRVPFLSKLIWSASQDKKPFDKNNQSLVISHQTSLLHRGLLQSRLGKNIPAARGGWEEEKLKRVGNAPALLLPFLFLVFTNWSLCGGESHQTICCFQSGSFQ